ncbi:MAG: J domain-containing protein [Zoogloea sp.]|jgi:curved DNA-binding protein CbpA|uniref:J domain-containing protein n=1 Tax=Dokdonella sp. TaxID=2291710 RepID=UPI001B52063A|nr:DnaJ domain-containing protein [Dokdonella sp.]MBL0284837.1 J domain-containing protein [Zoogloea sp.]MBP7393553.1 J domain-containing protein [Zoogloea sp.]
MRDPYEILGVSPSAPAEDIKVAYRKAARLYHPDKNPDPAAADRFRSIQSAYELLADPTRRRDYDLLRQRNLIDDPLQEASSLWASYIEKVIS